MSPDTTQRHRCWGPSVQERRGRRTAGQARQDSHQPCWKASWLRSSTLGAIAIVSVFFAAGSIVLRQSSLRSDGIEILSDNHYLWTYGPTTLLVLVVAAWRQLDHETKILTPWSSLEQGNCRAQDGVRLDYVSPLLIVSVVEAIKKRHYAVSSSVFGFAVLKLVTLASTALLDVREFRVTTAMMELVRTSIFNSSLFNETAFNADTDSSAVYDAFGLTSYDVEHADGVGNGFVYETFRLPAGIVRADMALRANVFTLEPDFRCSAAEVTINTDFDDTPLSNASRGRVQIDSPICTFTGVEPTFLIDGTILETQVAPRVQRRGSMQRVTCTNFESLGSNKDNLQLLVLAEIEYSQDFAETEANSTRDVGVRANITNWTANVRKTKSIICNPQLSLRNSSILYAPFEPDVVASIVDRLGPPTFFDSFTGFNLSNAFVASMLDAAGLFGVASAANGLLLEDSPNTMFKMMADVLFHKRSEIGISGYEILLADDSKDASMMEAANSVFKAVASQIIHKNIRQPVEEPLDGELSFTERRLVVSETSLWLMFGGLLLVVLITGHIWLQRPFPAVPHQPEAFIAISGQLPQDEELAGLLTKAADLSNKNRDALLDQYRFGGAWSLRPLQRRSTFELYSTFSTTPDTPLIGPEQHSNTPRGWWIPFMLRPAMILVTLTLPVLAIGALEAVHQVSLGKAQNTVVVINQSDAGTALLWVRITPALVMLLIATLFNSVDFNMALLGPLNALKRQNLPVVGLLDKPLFGTFPPLALWQALQYHLWPVAASMSAAVIGSALTIVVSGLFTLDAATQNSTLNVPKSETFNTTTASAMIDPADAAALVSLLESSNLSYPANTYDALAFTSLGSVSGASLDSNITLEVELPALRASLGCIALPSEAFSSSIFLNPRIGSASVNVDVEAALPTNCQRGGPDGNLSFIEIPFSQTLSSSTDASYIGKLLSLHVGPYDPILDSSFGETSPNQPDNPPGCPSLAFIYGTVNPTTNTTNLTTLICTQHLQLLDIHTFLTSSRRIINATLLSDAATTPYLPASPMDPNQTAFPFRIQQTLDQTLSIFNQSAFPSAANADSPVDPFFQAVLFGRTGLFASSTGEAAFASTTDADRRVVFDAVETFYRRYMAQALSLRMRQPLPVVAGAGGRGGAGEEEVWRVTTHDVGTKLKLVMHRESKLALQGMLGLMVLLLGYAVWSSGGMREVVRHNPCEIWGRLQLVVGSRLAEEMQRRAKEGGLRSAQEDWAGWEVRLGWWEREAWQGGGKRWGIDLIEPAQKTVLRRELGGGKFGTVAAQSVEQNARAGWI